VTGSEVRAMFVRAGVRFGLVVVAAMVTEQSIEHITSFTFWHWVLLVVPAAAAAWFLLWTIAILTPWFAGPKPTPQMIVVVGLIGIWASVSTSLGSFSEVMAAKPHTAQFSGALVLFGASVVLGLAAMLWFAVGLSLMRGCPVSRAQQRRC
jgi:hypothetical protein